MNVYVSSIALAGMPFHEMVSRAIKKGFPLEFSSGMPPCPDAVSAFLEYPNQKLSHNYFPAPEDDPFVINLGSFNDYIRDRSIDHCLYNLYLSAQVGAPFYAAHAGFSIDPDPAELGQPLSLPTELPNLEYCEERFIAAVDRILMEAAKKGVSFFIENNVIAPFNLIEGGGNPLLGCTAAHLSKWGKHFSNRPFGILLDTAHLKVSSLSLGLNLDEEMEVLAPYIAAIHHSDNDGTQDNNQPLTETYWFGKYVSRFSHLPQVLEVRKLTDDAVEEQLALLRKFALT